MGKASVWSNNDGLAVGFGTRTETSHCAYKLDDEGELSTIYLRFKGEDLGDAVAATDDAVVYGPVIPNGSTIIDATLEVIEAFDSAGDAGVLDIGLYTPAGSEVDDDGIDSAVAQAAIDAIGDTIACDGADVATVVATAGGVKVAASYDTAAFTAGEAVLKVRFTTTT